MKIHLPLTCLGQKSRYSLAMQTRKRGFSFSKYSEPRGRPCMPEKCSSAASRRSAVTSCSPLCFLEASRAWRKTSTCGDRPRSRDQHQQAGWLLGAGGGEGGGEGGRQQRSRPPWLLSTRDWGWGGQRTHSWAAPAPWEY